MARSDKYKDHLDRVYYALGNIYLSEADTANAIAAYESGRGKSENGGTHKGVLLLKLGEIYWSQRRFDLAQSCYTDAIGMLSKERKDFDEITRRSKVLDKLVPHTNVIHLQDSLQALALMTEAERNAAIDRVIELLKKKEEAERQQQLDSAAQARSEQNGGGESFGDNNQPSYNQGEQNGINQGGSSTWYFYNSMAVMQGKQDFRKQWGQRKNEDNWRRSNRTVVAMEEEGAFDYEADDSLQAAQDSLMLEEEAADSVVLADPANDPHNREYYLRQIPFTPEAKAASDALLKDALYNAGIIEKDDLEDFPLAAETLGRLTQRYTDFDRMAEAYYQLYLLYARWGKTDLAEATKEELISRYPVHELTHRISNPNYLLYARRGREIEDSLYTKTYEAYRNRRNDEVKALFERSTKDFPTGLNRPKFMFVHTLSRLQSVDSPTLIAELRELLKAYPESDVSTMAGMMVKGLESGRMIASGTFDLGSLWNRRTAAADSLSAGGEGARTLTADRQIPFLFVLAYPSDSIIANELLYEVARYNFSGNGAGAYDLSFDMSMPGISQFRVAGFGSYEAARVYARKAYSDPVIRKYLTRGRILLISKANLDLLGTLYSYDDYRVFYDEHFDDSPIVNEQSESIEEPIEQHYEDEYTPEELERIRGKKTEEEVPLEDDGGEWY